VSRKIIYVDMDGVLVDLPELGKVDPSIRDECMAWQAEQEALYPDKEIHHSDFEGLFATLKPMEGAVEAIDTLMSDFDVFLLSTAPWANTSSWTDKRRWVERYLPNLGEKHLILTHRKDLNRGAFLIDDRPNNGAMGFGKIEGQEWIHFASAEFPGWPSVLSYLEGKA
jgi:5'(3')-deoxyribonucleotidase